MLPFIFLCLTTNLDEKKDFTPIAHFRFSNVVLRNRTKRKKNSNVIRTLIRTRPVITHSFYDVCGSGTVPGGKSVSQCIYDKLIAVHKDTVRAAQVKSSSKVQLGPWTQIRHDTHIHTNLAQNSFEIFI